jgi:hypothetical protein
MTFVTRKKIFRRARAKSKRAEKIFGERKKPRRRKCVASVRDPSSPDLAIERFQSRAGEIFICALLAASCAAPALATARVPNSRPGYRLALAVLPARLARARAVPVEGN